MKKKTFIVPVNFDGIICVEAISAEEARNIVCEKTKSEILSEACGTLDVDEAEADEEE